MQSTINIKVKPEDLFALLTIAETFGYKCFDNRSVKTYTDDFKKTPWACVRFRRNAKDWQGSDSPNDFIWETDTLKVIQWLENKVDNTCKLNDSYTATFESDGIHVGCQKFSYDAIETLYKKSVEFKHFYKL
jgi:hypothetical protein